MDKLQGINILAKAFNMEPHRWYIPKGSNIPVIADNIEIMLLDGELFCLDLKNLTDVKKASPLELSILLYATEMTKYDTNGIELENIIKKYGIKLNKSFYIAKKNDDKIVVEDLTQYKVGGFESNYRLYIYDPSQETWFFADQEKLKRFYEADLLIPSERALLKSSYKITFKTELIDRVDYMMIISDLHKNSRIKDLTKTVLETEVETW